MINEEVNRYIPNLHPLIDYVFEDIRGYPRASFEYIDEDNDFMIGDSGGLLMDLSFIFVNVDQFSEVANHFDRTKSSPISEDGVYTYAKPGTEEYRNFWKRETHRRRVGMTIKGKLYRNDIDKYNNAKNEIERDSYLYDLHITGDFYTFLNYSRIFRTPSIEERKWLDSKGRYKQTKIFGFPRFWDGHYWNFKLDYFIVKNGFHEAKSKCRRRGYSFQRGSQSANTINLNPNVTIVLTAWDMKFLTDPGATTDMLKRNLDWFENHTYWRRGYISEDLTAIQLGYRLQKEGNKNFGYQSKALSLTCFNNPNVVVGKDAIEIDVEEAGVNPVLQQLLNVTTSAMESGETQTGTLRIYGTGGTKEANWTDFAYCYYNPAAYGMVPLENVWDTASRFSTCGFFHPQIWNYDPFMDENGNSFLVQAFLRDKEKKTLAAKNMQADDFIIYCGQRANSPNEAFNSSTENIFSSIELNEHIKWVRSNQEEVIKKDGQFVETPDPKDPKRIFTVRFIPNETIIAESNKPHPYILNVPFKAKDDVYGAWRIYHEPKTIGGKIPDDLYAIMVDPVGKDKTIKEVNTKNSLNAIYVYSLPNSYGITPDIICGIYVGRRDDSQESCSREALKGAMYWNAKVLPETDRGTVVSDFKRWLYTWRLIKNPLTPLNPKVKESQAVEYGIYIGEGSNAVDAIINLKQFIYEKIAVTDNETPVFRLHYITDLPTLIELQNYNSKKNFDRISAMRLYPYYRAWFTMKRKDENKSTIQGTSILRSIGLYQ
jgi:hypothetical protein